MSAAKEVLELLEGEHFYLDTAQADPWKLSCVLGSTKSENMISIACFRGDYSAVHCVVDEFPSISPAHLGQQKKKTQLFTFRAPADLAHWMKKYMDSSEPFYPAGNKTYYAGLEDGLPDSLKGAAEVTPAPAQEAAQ
jgi:hypothetical protein